MEIYRLMDISEEEYNTALFEIGCEVLEERYGHRDAQLIMRHRGCWKWMQVQRDITDSNLYHVLKYHKMPKQAGKSYNLYYNALRSHLQMVYFPRQIEKQLLQKEVCNG